MNITIISSVEEPFPGMRKHLDVAGRLQNWNEHRSRGKFTLGSSLELIIPDWFGALFSEIGSTLHKVMHEWNTNEQTIIKDTSSITH